MKQRIFRNTYELEKEASIEETFPFLPERKHVISFVGAGGKTSLIYELAGWCCSRGYRTLVTTTTHMYRPPEELRAYEASDLERLWNQGKIAVLGADSPDGKICMPPQKELEEGIRKSDMVLIEADGAKRLPCKVPKESEPVLLPESDLVIGVMGMNALGKPLQEVCFRADLARELLRADGNHLMTTKDLAEILCSDRGTRKLVGSREYLVVLNQCDTQERMRQGAKLADRLYEKNIQHVILSGTIDS